MEVSLGFEIALGRHVIWGAFNNDKLRQKLCQGIKDYRNNAKENNTQNKLKIFVESLELSTEKSTNVLSYLTAKLKKTEDKQDGIDRINKFFDKIFNNKMVSLSLKHNKIVFKEKIKVCELEISHSKENLEILKAEFKEKLEEIEPFPSNELEKLYQDLKNSPSMDPHVVKNLCAMVLELINKKDYPISIEIGIGLFDIYFSKEKFVGNHVLLENVYKKYSFLDSIFFAYQKESTALRFKTRDLKSLKERIK